MAPARDTAVAWFFSEFLAKVAGIEHGPAKLLLMWTVGFVPAPVRPAALPRAPAAYVLVVRVALWSIVFTDLADGVNLDVVDGRRSKVVTS